MMKWLNPVNWIKAAIAAKVESEVEAKMSKEFLTAKGGELVNYLIELSESKVDDTKVEAVCRDLVFCGESLLELARAIEPTGEEGRKLSKNEIGALQARLQVLFGDVVTEDRLEEWRDEVKEFVVEKLGL